MSDELTQAQIDAMIKGYLPLLESNVPVEGVVYCPNCKTGTKRIVFTSNYPMTLKIITASSNLMKAGKIPANSIFCCECGTLYDNIDRSLVRDKLVPMDIPIIRRRGWL